MISALDGALSNTASAGLILGSGAIGSGLLVLGLTVMALRRGAREEALERERDGVRETARRRTRRMSGATAVDELGAHDPYPQQPYSPKEPRSHKPYSRPYKMPRQEAYGKTNGHRPPESAASGIPSVPFTPPEDEG